MFGACLNARYDENATCPEVDAELEAKFKDVNDRKVMRSFGAYIGIPDCRFNIGFLFLGDTHTGKSTITEAICSVYGDELRDNVPMDRLTPGDTFKRDFTHRLATKLVNLATELNPAKIHADTSFIKKQISGEGHVSDPKYGQIFGWKGPCKLAHDMNELPKIDGTEADSIRWKLVYFAESHKGNADFEVAKKLTSQKERNGMYQGFLRELLELMKTKKFPEAGERSKRWGAKLSGNIDMFTRFLQVRNVDLVEGHIELPSEISAVVRSYLQEYDLLQSISEETFKKRLRLRFDLETTQKRYPRSRRQYSIWIGLRINRDKDIETTETEIN
jgi:phage/plasmid-associated DNA primase